MQRGTLTNNYINNDGKICSSKNKMISAKAECLAHYSYEKSNHQLMLLEIQGCGYRLFDPEIASTTLLDDENEFLFTAGNLQKKPSALSSKNIYAMFIVINWNLMVL